MPEWTCHPVSRYSIIDRKTLSQEDAHLHRLRPDIATCHTSWKLTKEKKYTKKPFSPRLQDLRFCVEALGEHLSPFRIAQADAPVAIVLQRFTSLGLCYTNDEDCWEYPDEKSYFVHRESNCLFVWKEQCKDWRDSKGAALERQLVRGGKGENVRVVTGSVGQHVLFCAGEVDAWTEDQEPVEIKLNLKDASAVHDYFQSVNIGISQIWSQSGGRMIRTSVSRLKVPPDVKRNFHLNLAKLFDQLVEKVQPGIEYELKVGPGYAKLEVVRHPIEIPSFLQ